MLRLRSYFFPENVAASHLTDDLESALADNEFYVVNYAPTPCRGVSEQIMAKYKKIKYEEFYSGKVVVHRFSMFSESNNVIQKTLRYVMCGLKEYLLGINEKNVDLVFSSSTPPTQGMLSAMVARKLSKRYGRKVPFVFNLQDIFPDSLVNSGLTKTGSLIWKIGRKIENYTYTHADRIIVISEGFKRNIMAKGVPENKIVIASNWVDLNTVMPIDRQSISLFDEFGIDRSKFIVLYAGNLGEAQGADIIIDVAKELRMEANIQFVIFGGGAKYQEIKDRIEKEGIINIIISGLQPQERVSEVYSMGDIALITCRPGIGNAGMPSKTWSIMACNTPIVASFDLDSDLADVINKSGAGCCVKPGNAKALKEAIQTAYEDWKKGRVKQNNLRNYVLQTVSKEICVQKYIDAFQSVVVKGVEDFI